MQAGADAEGQEWGVDDEGGEEVQGEGEGEEGRHGIPEECGEGGGWGWGRGGGGQERGDSREALMRRHTRAVPALPVLEEKERERETRERHHTALEEEGVAVAGVVVSGGGGRSPEPVRLLHAESGPSSPVSESSVSSVGEAEGEVEGPVVPVVMIKGGQSQFVIKGKDGGQLGKPGRLKRSEVSEVKEEEEGEVGTTGEQGEGEGSDGSDESSDGESMASLDSPSA